MNFSFTNPSYLILLFLIPAMIFFHFYSLSNIRGRALRFANYEAIARVRGIDLYSKGLTVLTLNILIVLSLVFALSGLTLHTQMKSGSFSYVIAVDSSESMGATDIQPDRLASAKGNAIDFVYSLPTGTKVGVTSFSGNTRVEHELSSNKESLKNSINDIEITNIGGTDLYEAFFTSSNMLVGEENKAIILLSDGQINIGSLDEVIQDAIRNEIVIHTIGIGTIAGGNTSFGLSKLDEDTLKSLSYSSEGKYFSVVNSEKMKESFEEIIPLTTKLGSINLSIYLMILTIILFIISQIANQITRISI